MATPPVFIADNEGATGWDVNTTPKTSAAFNSAIGDVWVVGAVAEGNDDTHGTPTNTGTAQTFTARGAIDQTNYTESKIYTAVVANTLTSQTISQAKTTSVTNIKYNFNAVRFSGSNGIGATPVGEAETNNTAPSLTFTTTGDNSAIVCVVGCWNASDGTSRVWRTVNGIIPTAGNGFELTYFRNAANYSVYIAYWPDAGAAGSKTVGLSAPTTFKASITAVEVLGTAGAAPTTQILLMPARSA